MSELELPLSTSTRPVPWNRRKWVERFKEYAFILPAILVLSVVILFPMLWATYLSFFQVTLVPPNQAFMGFRLEANGLANYAELVRDPTVWNALRNTVIFTVATVGGSFIIGLALAILLNQPVFAQSVWRVLILIPWVVSPVVVATTWRWMYEPRYGVLNDIWRRIAPDADLILWLARPELALAAVCIAEIWSRTPFMVVMLLAALQAIPTEQYEAAAIDGASAWQRFLYVTLPFLRPIAMVATILAAIWAFRSFDIVQVLTGGGPGRATEVLSTHVYKTSFVFFRFGYSSAIAVSMMVVLLIFAIFYTRLLERD